MFFHVPKVSLNLLSVGQLCELSVDVHFLSRGCFVKDPQTGEILGTGHKVGRLFELKSLRIPIKIVAAAVTSSIWHARLGHPSCSRLGSLISSGCLSYVKQEYFDCVSCQLFKHHALPFSNSNFVPSAPFYLLYSDI